MANFCDNAPSLYIQTGEDKSQLFRHELRQKHPEALCHAPDG